MFLLKLALVCAVVLAASMAAKRFGHGVAGTLSGLPMIAGPIMGFVLLQAPLSQAHAIAVATLVAYPAMVSHMAAFAHAVRRWPWWVSLLVANAVFLAVGGLLVWIALPLPAACVLAALAPWAGLRSMPAHRRERTVLHIPPIELVLRVAAAAALAAAIMGGASVFPAALSGLLLALPITGNVLPCFTRARHGADATIELLAGFVRGMVGFGAFFIVLALALPTFGAGLSYAAAWGLVLIVASARASVTPRRADPR
jgi:hypothetical protein